MPFQDNPNDDQAASSVPRSSGSQDAKMAPAQSEGPQTAPTYKDGRSQGDPRNTRTEEKHREEDHGSKRSHYNRTAEGADGISHSATPSGAPGPQPVPTKTVKSNRERETPSITSQTESQRNRHSSTRQSTRNHLRSDLQTSDSSEEYVYVDHGRVDTRTRPRTTSFTPTGISRASDQANRTYAAALARSVESEHTSYHSQSTPSRTQPVDTQIPIYEKNNTNPAGANAQRTPSSQETTAETTARSTHMPGVPLGKEGTGTPQIHENLAEAASTPMTSSGYSIGGMVRSFMPAVILTPAQLAEKTKDELRATQGDLHRARAELDNYKMELQRTRGELRTYSRNCHDLAYERNKLRDINQSLQHELNNVQKKFEDAKALSDTRGKELIGAQVFLTKADSLSISDVIQRVNGLNEEIFQAAASLGESLFRKKYDLSDDQMNLHFQEVCRLIGEPLATIVVGEAQKLEPQVNPFLVQVVLQVFLVQFCRDKISLWTPDKKVDDYLGVLYDQIWNSEDQAVSGRWRALTRKQIRPVTDSWKGELTIKLMGVLQLAGWNCTPEQRASFENQLVPIFKAVQDIRIAIGENFTSADLDIALISPMENFAKGWMEEAYDNDGDRSDHGKVIATTGLGLRKVMPSDGPHTRDENVLCPKVILESSLKVALEPAPQRTSRKGGTRRNRDERQDGQRGGGMNLFG